MVEDSGVLLDSRIENNRAHYLYACLCKWRSAEHKSVRGRKLFLYSLHTFPCLIRCCCPGKNCPDLGVEVDLSFFVALCSVNGSVLADCPDPPFSVPAFFLDCLVKLFALSQSPIAFFFFTKAQGDVGICRESKTQLECNEK